MKRFLLSLAILVACGTPPVQASTPFDETRPLHPDARVELGNLKGLIEVDTWERDEIRIAGQRGDGRSSPNGGHRIGNGKISPPSRYSLFCPRSTPSGVMWRSKISP